VESADADPAARELVGFARHERESVSVRYGGPWLSQVFLAVVILFLGMGLAVFLSRYRVSLGRGE
jgi:hypothetical protein